MTEPDKGLYAKDLKVNWFEVYCKLCDNIIVAEHYFCNIGNYKICLGCYKKLSDIQQCCICGKNYLINLIKRDGIQINQEKALISCEYSDFGCEVSLKFEEIMIHKWKCPYRILYFLQEKYTQVTKDASKKQIDDFQKMIPSLIEQTLEGLIAQPLKGIEQRLSSLENENKELKQIFSEISTNDPNQKFETKNNSLEANPFNNIILDKVNQISSEIHEIKVNMNLTNENNINKNELNKNITKIDDQIKFINISIENLINYSKNQINNKGLQDIQYNSEIKNFALKERQEDLTLILNSFNKNFQDLSIKLDNNHSIIQSDIGNNVEGYKLVIRSLEDKIKIVQEGINSLNGPLVSSLQKIEAKIEKSLEQNNEINVTIRDNLKKNLDSLNDQISNLKASLDGKFNNLPSKISNSNIGLSYLLKSDIVKEENKFITETKSKQDYSNQEDKKKENSPQKVEAKNVFFNKKTNETNNIQLPNLFPQNENSNIIVNKFGIKIDEAKFKEKQNNSGNIYLFYFFTPGKTLYFNNLKENINFKVEVYSSNEYVDAVYHNNSVFVCGGYFIHYLNNCAIVHLDTRTIDSSHFLITKRHMTSLISDGLTVYCLGGYNGFATSSCECFDYSQNSWKNIRPMINPNSGVTSSFDPKSSFIYVLGGNESSKFERLNTAKVDSLWETVSLFNSSKRFYGCALNIHESEFLLFGGTNMTDEHFFVFDCNFSKLKKVQAIFKGNEFNSSKPIYLNGCLYIASAKAKRQFKINLQSLETESLEIGI